MKRFLDYPVKTLFCLFLLLALGACSSQKKTRSATKPAKVLVQKPIQNVVEEVEKKVVERPSGASRKGMVVAAHESASEVGLGILKKVEMLLMRLSRFNLHWLSFIRMPGISAGADSWCTVQQKEN